MGGYWVKLEKVWCSPRKNDHVSKTCGAHKEMGAHKENYGAHLEFPAGDAFVDDFFFPPLLSLMSIDVHVEFGSKKMWN